MSGRWVEIEPDKRPKGIGDHEDPKVISGLGPGTLPGAPGAPNI
jgi:hypothetical protein